MIKPFLKLLLIRLDFRLLYFRQLLISLCRGTIYCAHFFYNHNKLFSIAPLLLIVLLIARTTTHAQPQAFVINNLARPFLISTWLRGKCQNHVTVLGDTPNDIAYSGGFIYVLNSISANLQKIDPQTFQQVFDIPLQVGSNPYSVVLDSYYAYVSCLVSGEVDRIDQNTGQPHGEIVIGGCPEKYPLVLRNHLYVAQTRFNSSDFSYGQGRMAIINLTSFALKRGD